MTRWQRPTGPLNVWKVVDGYEILADGRQRPGKFSIQEIPNEIERKKEALDLLFTYYLPREPFHKFLNIMEDVDGVNDNTRTFEFALDYNISVGCYKIDSDGKIGDLIGVNLLFVMTEETFKDLQILRNTFKSNDFIRIWDFVDNLSTKANPFKIFQVDKYIASRGFCVHPTYKGQHLGYHILTARSAIGKKYGIHATASVFTGNAAQLQANRAGFEAIASLNYAEFIDDQGNPYFSSMESRSAKLMMKMLP